MASPQALLAKLGLNDKEAKIFLALAKLGPAPVRTVAQQAGINRGTTYDTLKHLLSLGLVSYYHREKHQYFVAERPERLLSYTQERVQQAEVARHEVESGLTTLERAYASSGEVPTVKFYEGFHGAKTILRDVLTTMSHASHKEYYVYSSVDLRQHLYHEFPNFTDERVKRGIKVLTIAIGAGGSRHGLDERRWLSKKEGAPTFVIIYDGKVATLALDGHGNLVGTVIENRAVADTERLIFKALWDKLVPAD